MDFVNEGKLDEERKRRQAEWERIRNPSDPVEAPAEVFDNRSLYERLKEQHEIKKKDFEDSYALKNRIRGIDVDEANFLNEYDEARLKKEREIRMEEKKEIEEIKKATASKAVPEAIPKINLNLPSHKKENKQAELLSSVVLTKRKSQPGTTAATVLLKSNELSKTHKGAQHKSKLEEMSSSDSDELAATTATTKKFKSEKSEEERSKNSNVIVAGVLPGIGDYDSDSSSDSGSSTEDENDLSTSEIISRNLDSNSAADALTK